MSITKIYGHGVANAEWKALAHTQLRSLDVGAPTFNFCLWQKLSQLISRWDVKVKQQGIIFIADLWI